MGKGISQSNLRRASSCGRCSISQRLSETLRDLRTQVGEKRAERKRTLSCREQGKVKNKEQRVDRNISC